ncbi:hypothetical protein [Hydrogenophaga sp. T2]|uniref:hypothetical protein n=1 Tax=Hydrogenophaga sp. T2 TaxID=3132823 RepID=UPI003CF39BB8
MTDRDQIIAWAREAGFKPQSLYMEAKLERFASLVAAHEREQCAQIADDMDYSPDGAIAAAIRGRAEK